MSETLPPPAGETPAEPAADPQPTGETPTFESWLESQDETVRSLYEQHTSGLKSALKSERGQREALQKDLAKLTKSAEEGSAIRAELEHISTKLQAESARADFFEAAATAKVRNPRLAYMAAQADGLISDKGIDFDTLRANYPELFEATPAQRPTPGNAGTGMGSGSPPALDMNARLRQAAGRK